jgi:O-antigen/teichoic acid export membrane protein
MIRGIGAIALFFGLRISCALVLLKLAASQLTVGGFADFSQYLAFASLVTLMAVGGVQNGLIRQVAASGSRTELVETLAAAGWIWLVASAALLFASLLGANFIAVVLVGHTGDALVIFALTAVAILAGPGQIRCSTLSGRGRMIASLAIQGVGLVVGTAAAAFFTWRGQAAAAALAFACGSVVPSVPVIADVWRGWVKPSMQAVAVHIRQLVRFSIAFGAVAAAAPLTLFALRWQYRETFGQTALAHWLSANRISDLSTQLIGLFMVQIFVPKLTRMTSPEERRRFILTCGFVGMAVMAVPLLTFSVAAEPLVRLFLSPAFVPAIPAIQTYMAGDMLRIWTSMAIYTAFAHGKAERYAALELLAVGSIAALTLLLMREGFQSAPQWAYFATHAGFCAVLLAVILIPSRSATASRMAQTVWRTLKTSARQL